MEKKNKNKGIKSKSIEKSKNIVKKKKSKSPKKIKKKNISVKKSKSKTKTKSKGKSSKKSGKKSKKKKKTSPVELEEKNNNNENKIITDNIKVQKKTEEKKIIEIKPKKIFAEARVGTPHLDVTKFLKEEIEEKDKIINKLSNIKSKYANELKNIFEKLEDVLINFRQTPEQINKIRLLYLILNINKKNNNDSIIKNKSLKEEYKILLNRNNYNPIQRINEFRTKIDISKNENMDMRSQINELKYNHIKRRNNLRLFALNDKYTFQINTLTDELNTLNNEKQKAINRLKHNKKAINSCIFKFNNLLQAYEIYKKENININDNNIKKIDKDINILKKDFVGDEEEIYNKILSNKMQIMKEISIPLKIKKRNVQFFEKITNNNSSKNDSSSKITWKKIKILKRSESLETIKVTKSYYNNKNDVTSLRKKFLNINELPKINLNNKTINIDNNTIKTNKNNNSAINILNNDKDKSILEELNISQINEMDYNDINNKKEHYNNIIKKLDYSIKEVESMYKRKNIQVQEELNESKNKLINIKNINNMITKEIDNLTNILNLQKKYIIEELTLNKENKNKITILQKENKIFNTELKDNIDNNNEKNESKENKK